MSSTQNAVANHEYRSVPITALAESATNPRKRFDAKSLEELAASFKTQGILQTASSHPFRNPVKR